MIAAIAVLFAVLADPADAAPPEPFNWTPVITALLSLAAGVFGTLVASRNKRREDAATARKEHRADRQEFIDQIQEERNTYAQLLREEREDARAERAENAARLDRMWGDKAASREYVANLRAHIHKGSPPPPPGPPAGYIE